LLLQDRGDLDGADKLQKKVYEDIKAAGGPLPSCVQPIEPLSEQVLALNTAVINTVKGAIDIIYKDRDVQRFYVLETVARVPYFAYLSCLHLYETFGDRGSTRRLRTHYAEADNELHHLLIMEELGGNDDATDRFIAQALAFSYYWYSVAIYLVSPQAAYHLGELIEEHAYRTYDKFLNKNEKELRKRPVPDIAREYYSGRDALESYLADTSQISLQKHSLIPGSGVKNTGRQLNSLYDVFVEIRNDEAAHWRTLKNLVEYGDLDSPDGCPMDF